MAKLTLKKAATDVTVYLFAQASNVTTGAGLTGLTFETASLTAYYVRPLGSATAITLATQTVTGSHSDGGFVEVDATNMPGVYRLDLPDAVCATGVPSAVVMLKGATNLAPVLLEIQLTDFDLNTAAITAAGVADAVWDEATADHTTATTFGSLDANVDAILTDTGTDGVVIGATQGAITWGQQKIIADVAGEGALDIENSNSGGAGQHNKGGSSSAGLWNEATIGTLNDGGSIGLVNSGVQAVDGFDTRLALEATLNGIMGAGWTDETLVKIVTDIAAISAGSGATPQQIWEYATRVLTAGTNIDLSSLATAAHVQEVEDKVDTAVQYAGEASYYSSINSGTLGQVASDIAAILIDTGTTLDALIKDVPTNAELATALGTADDAVLAAIAAAKGVIDNIHDTDLPAVKAETALIVEDTGTTLPATLAGLATTTHVQEVEDKVDTAVQSAGEASYYSSINSGTLGQVLSDTAAIAAVKSVVDAILVDTGTTLDGKLNTIDTNVDSILDDTGTTLPASLATLAGYTDGIAGDVWSHAKRTLTHPSVSAEEPEDSNTLILYRDADIAIELTDLTIPAGAKKYIFTIKDNLDSGDDQAVLQASYAIDGSEVETNTLVYINSAAAPVLTNPVTFTLTDTNITIDLTAEAAALLPRYERGYLNWDLKLVTDASVTIVLQGLAQIIGTSTRAIE